LNRDNTELKGSSKISFFLFTNGKSPTRINALHRTRTVEIIPALKELKFLSTPFIPAIPVYYTAIGNVANDQQGILNYCRDNTRVPDLLRRIFKLFEL